jgi:very-short-patch-repair endonuclease
MAWRRQKIAVKRSRRKAAERQAIHSLVTKGYEGSVRFLGLGLNEQYSDWVKGKRIKEQKQALRNPTPAERLAKAVLLPQGYRFQERLTPFYRVDFVNYELMLIIEIDGASHCGREVYDQNREQSLGTAGYDVLRFTNRQIFDLKSRGELVGDPRVWHSRFVGRRLHNTSRHRDVQSGTFFNGSQLFKARRLLREAGFHPELEVWFGRYRVDLLIRGLPARMQPSFIKSGRRLQLFGRMIGPIPHGHVLAIGMDGSNHECNRDDEQEDYLCDHHRLYVVRVDASEIDT